MADENSGDRDSLDDVFGELSEPLHMGGDQPGTGKSDQADLDWLQGGSTTDWAVPPSSTPGAGRTASTGSHSDLIEQLFGSGRDQAAAGRTTPDSTPSWSSPSSGSSRSAFSSATAGTSGTSTPPTTPTFGATPTTPAATPPTTPTPRLAVPPEHATPPQPSAPGFDWLYGTDTPAGAPSPAPRATSPAPPASSAPTTRPTPPTSRTPDEASAAPTTGPTWPSSESARPEIVRATLPAWPDSSKPTPPAEPTPTPPPTPPTDDEVYAEPIGHDAAAAADLEWLYGSLGSEAATPTTPEPSPTHPDPVASRLDIGGAALDATPDSFVMPTVEPPDDYYPDEPEPAPAPRPKPAPAPRPKQTKAAKATKTGHKHPVRNGIIAVAAVLLAWVVFIVVAPLHAFSGMEKVPDTPIGLTGARLADQPGTTFLIIGTDSREDLTPEEQEMYTTGDIEGSRTDTMLLYHVPEVGSPVLISLPRDSYVEIPGNGQNKLNAAYAIGGGTLLLGTVENLTGIRIDGYLEIGMGGFARLVDAVGGVEICPEEAISDPNSGLNVQPGCQEADGTTALAWARMRYADPRGDLGRVERQRALISQIAKKMLQVSTIANPIKWWRTTHALVDTMKIGEQTGLGTVLSAAWGGRAFMSDGVVLLTVPVSNPNVSTNVGSAVLWDDAAAAELFGMVASGNTTGVEKFAQ